MTNRNEGHNVVHAIIVDSLTGNDYSICLCRGLSEAGVDVELVTVEERSMPFPVAFPVHDWAPSKQQQKSRIRKSVDYLRYLIRLFLYVAKKSRGGRCVVHFQFFRRPRVESLCPIFFRLIGARLVFTAHNIVPHESAKIDWWLKGLVYRSVHEVIVHSDFIKKALLTAFPLPPSKVHVVPHGNFDHYLSDTDLPKPAARNRLGLNSEDNVVLFFGYIREYKGLDLLLEALPRAVARDTRLRLVIAGAPHTEALKARYMAMIEQSGVSDRILFHAHFIDSEQVSVYFNAADLVVLPYKNIYHSGIIHLAYSYGKPVVATNVGDFSETIVCGRSGVVLKENTAGDLSDALLDSFADANRLVRMGKYARELSVTKYSWHDIGAATRSIYAA